MTTFACLLGPQRFRPTVAEALRVLGVDGPIAVVTAGWQEREDEDRELRDHVAREVVNLRLYHRCEEVYRDDRELFLAIRRRQDRLRELQRIYRTRLAHLMDSARELMARPGPTDLLEPERDHAIETVRSLDRHHVERIRQVHDEFERRWQPQDRLALIRHRNEIFDILRRVSVLAVAGGHVAILLNRLRLFRLRALRPDLPVVAWSAGAMALADRIFLFHDSPPQGPGHAEVLDVGLGRFRAVVPLPHAARRLRLDDRQRVSILARRCEPDMAVALDAGAMLTFRAGRWVASPGTRRLDPRGTLEEVTTS